MLIQQRAEIHGAQAEIVVRAMQQAVAESAQLELSGELAPGGRHHLHQAVRVRPGEGAGGELRLLPDEARQQDTSRVLGALRSSPVPGETAAGRPTPHLGGCSVERGLQVVRENRLAYIGSPGPPRLGRSPAEQVPWPRREAVHPPWRRSVIPSPQNHAGLPIQANATVRCGSGARALGSKLSRAVVLAVIPPPSPRKRKLRVVVVWISLDDSPVVGPRCSRLTGLLGQTAEKVQRRGAFLRLREALQSAPTGASQPPSCRRSTRSRLPSNDKWQPWDPQQRSRCTPGTTAHTSQDRSATGSNYQPRSGRPAATRKPGRGA